MVKFDFFTYTKSFFNIEEYNSLYNKKNYYIEKLKNNAMTAWTKEIDNDLVSEIKTTAEYIKNNFDCLVVVGIGGSYLGSYSFMNAFKPYFNNQNFEIIYAGTTLSSKYLDELLIYLNNKNFCLNVISKSGDTLETKITYKLLKDALKRKYKEEDLAKHIIITTDKQSGSLREEVTKYNYKSFEIPKDIGGRYSFITPAHLLPLAINYNIDLIIDGYYDGKRLIDEAYQYAIVRNLLFKKGKVIENFCIYEESLSYFTEWLKQLFGETEGKNELGIFPTSTLFTRDLHSIGQFIQEGNKILFETVINIKNSKNYIEYQGINLNSFNNIIVNSVIKAHHKGNTPCLEIEMDELTLENLATLIYFFELSAAFSGFLFDVDPFNQPGVEIYKQEIKKSLNEEL